MCPWLRFSSVGRTIMRRLSRQAVQRRRQPPRRLWLAFEQLEERVLPAMAVCNLVPMFLDDMVYSQMFLDCQMPMTPTAPMAAPPTTVINNASGLFANTAPVVTGRV